MTQRPSYSFAVVVCIEYVNKLRLAALAAGDERAALTLHGAAESMWKEREALVQQTRDAFGDECDPRPWNWMRDAK